jgi:IS4 transposase
MIGLDFVRLHVPHQVGAFFVTAAKSNVDAHRIYSAQSDRNAGVIGDQNITLDGFHSSKDYPERPRRIGFKDPETRKRLVFLTDQFILPTPTVCALYKCRWQVELLFNGSSSTRVSSSSMEPPKTW